jgi:hypothetical protein
MSVFLGVPEMNDERQCCCAKCGLTQQELDAQGIRTSKGEKAVLSFYDPKDGLIPENWQADYYCSACVETSFDPFWGQFDTYWDDEE